jgi:hypothetical protein
MKILLPLLLLLAASPAQGQDLKRSLIQFCSAIKSINRQGHSAVPGSAASMFIVAKSNQTASDYRMVWDYARYSNISSCRGIW